MAIKALSSGVDPALGLLVLGTEKYDHRTRGDGDDTIYGGLGNDRFKGGVGKDRICGGRWREPAG